MSVGMKMIYVTGLILAVIFTYVIMLALQGATNLIVSTANATTGNWTVDPGFQMAQGVMNSFPLWQWFIPGFVGLVSIVVVWRS